MIRVGDGVQWDEQPGRTLQGSDCGNIIQAGRGIVFAIARGNVPGPNGIESTPATRSYIVRSNEWEPYEERKVIWLTSVRPRDDLLASGSGSAFLPPGRPPPPP